jgi:hypothetical protein
VATVFISYRRQDSAQLAYLIKETLERQKISVFFDIKDLDTTGAFPPMISRAIAEAKVFICLLGPHTLESPWVCKEIEQAYNLGLTLIPVLQPGFTELANPPDSVKRLLEHQGVIVPEQVDYLSTTLDAITARVKSALKTPPAALSPKVLYAVLAVEVIVGLILILGIIAGLTDSLPLFDDDDENTPPAPTEAPSTGVWKTNLSDGDRVAQSITFIAEYTGDLDSDVWFFVQSPNGRLYPQSEDACQGKLAFHKDGRWEVRAGLGTPDASSIGGLFDILITVPRTPEDSQYIAYKLIAWCKQGNYPGFEMLPEEVSEVHRVKNLIRTDEHWEKPPDISNTQLQGQISVASLSEGDTVPDQVTVSGTYQNVVDEIWVLIFPWYGRWHPQSETPCAASHVLKENGQWTAPKVNFGGDSGYPFDIVVALANEEASTFFDRKQQFWCKAGYYPGLYTIELPQGIQEKARLRVYRE